MRPLTCPDKAVNLHGLVGLFVFNLKRRKGLCLDPRIPKPMDRNAGAFLPPHLRGWSYREGAQHNEGGSTDLGAHRLR